MTSDNRAGDALVTMGDEREVLEAFLDMHRGIVVRKLRGVAENAARQRLVPSRTTLAGLVGHLTSVEREWFAQVLAGRQITLPAGDGWDDGGDVEELIAAYEQACAESRAIAAGMDLSDGSAGRNPHLGQVSLRWVYVHMIEETARHVGHADILREQTDGATGFDG